jgi:hypothetical protein
MRDAALTPINDLMTREKRSNATHESKTDPDARLAKKAKGQEAKLSYQGSVLMENRHGLVVDAEVGGDLEPGAAMRGADEKSTSLK